VYLNVGFTNTDADRDDGAFAGSAKGKAYSLAGYWTHRDTNRWYVDSTLVGTYLNSLEIDPREDSGSTSGGWSVAGSLEGGRSMKLGSQSALQIQAQVIGQHIKQNDTQITGATISFADTNTVVGRVGLELGIDIDPETFSSWLRADYWSELSGDAATAIAAPNTEATIFHTTFEDDWVELSAGLTLQINKNAGIQASVSAAQGMNGSSSSALQGNVGFKIQW